VKIDLEEERLRAVLVQLVEVPDGVLLKRGCAEMNVEGDGAKEIVELLLGRAAGAPATRDELLDGVPAPAREAVADLVDQLRQRRILIAADESAEDVPEGPVDVFYWHFGARAADVVDRLASRRIAVIGVNSIGRQLLIALARGGASNVTAVDYPLLRNVSLFDSAGAISADDWPPAIAVSPFETWWEQEHDGLLDCVVATSDFGGMQLLRRWNEFCVERGIHFLPVVLQNLIGYVGPLVVPGETACFECLRARQNANLDDPEAQRAAEHAAFEGQSVAAFHPSMGSILGDLAAMELTKFYGGVIPTWRVGALVEVNLLQPSITTRSVLRIPRCSVCSPLRTRSSVSTRIDPFVPVAE
jgi:bacteriocin biosynthesis cyclodehydratase domain-containing protein